MGNRIQYPSKEALDETFRYEGGLLYWRHAAPKRDTSKPAGCKSRNGYLTVSLGKRENRKKFLLHRIVWIMHNGYEPDTIDHVNRKKDDNRIENLRDVSLSFNLMNRKDTHRLNALPKGITVQHGSYKAQRCVSGKNIFIGTYETVNEAVIAYKAFSKGAGLPLFESS